MAPASTSPAAVGTKEMDAGARAPSVGGSGASSEKTTFRWSMPRFFSSRRITRASGQTLVFADVANAKARGVELVARAHGADDGHARRRGPLDEQQLGRHRVDGVGYIVVGAQVEAPGALRVVKRLHGQRVRVRADGQRPRAHGLRLGHAHRLPRGDDLAVEIRFLHTVGVHERQMPDARAQKRFRGAAAHAAQTKDDHPRVVRAPSSASAPISRRVRSNMSIGRCSFAVTNRRSIAPLLPISRDLSICRAGFFLSPGNTCIETHEGGRRACSCLARWPS